MKFKITDFTEFFQVAETINNPYYGKRHADEDNMRLIVF